jgi:ribonucleoside-diphosphate reductase alpha chain
MGGKYVPSLLAAIGDIIERHLAGLPSAARPGTPLPQPEPEVVAAAPRPACPQCGSASLIKVEGCNNCLECGYSKCG